MEPINGTSISPGLNVVDLEEAEVHILKQVQSDAFPSEIRNLQTIQAKAKNGSRELDKEKKALLRKASFLRSLEPVLDSDGIMRVGERIRRANLSVTLKNLSSYQSRATSPHISSAMYTKERVMADEG